MNSAAAFSFWAKADAARLPCGWEKRSRGTFSDLAAAPHLPLTASAGRGPSTTPLGDRNSARARQVAAQMPGGGGVMLHVPANPFQEPAWKAVTIRPQSSIAFASCSKRARACARFAQSTACLPEQLSMHGCAVMTSSRPVSGKRARSAFMRSPRKACALRLRPLSHRQPTLRPLASHSTLYAGSWASCRPPSGTSRSSRGL